MSLTKKIKERGWFIVNINLENLSDDEKKRLLPENLIILGYRGSIAHGTYIPSNDPNGIDDIDLMGVFIPSMDHYFLSKFFPQNDKSHHEAFIKEWDAVSYEITKFISLLLKSNPNVLSMLWLNDEHYIYVHPVGRKLIENRDIFSSRVVYKSFVGYAQSQMHKMTHFKHEGYMGEKRKKLVAKFGYDTKNAAHMIRLLEMGIEFLNTGKLNVRRENSEKLLDIKHGKYSIDEIKEEAKKLLAHAERADSISLLPQYPDYVKAKQLCCDLICQYHEIIQMRLVNGKNKA